MCEPTTIALAGLAATVIGGGVQAYSSAQQGKYQSQVAKNNALIAERNAAKEIERGNYMAEQQGRRTAALISSQRAAGASSGIDINSGSSLDIQNDAYRLGREDALSIRSNAQDAAYNNIVQASNFRSSGDAAGAAGNLGIFTSLLGTASTVGSQWSSFKTSGMLK